MKYKKILCWLLILLLVISLSGCGGSSHSSVSDDSNYLQESDITINLTKEVTGDNEHYEEFSSGTNEITNTKIIKTGDASTSNSDDADWYGYNAAVLNSGGTLTISECVFNTNGSHANAIFSYGSDSVVNVSRTVITTSGNNSGGIMTTGGGTMNATNLTIKTSGGSSAAIRSDKGGGTVTVKQGYYETSGRGSPAVYSTADISVSNAYLKSTTAQGIVIEGKNSVSLNNCTVYADNTTVNGSNTSYKQGVMIYQSGSGDADSGTAEFEMIDSKFLNYTGDIFFINNTVANITLENSTITNNDSSGQFLRAEAAGWGTSGSNGGKVNLNASSQNIDGNITVDSVSGLNLYLDDSSTFNGAINSDGSTYVEISGSTWNLTADSEITSLTCEADSINLNGHTLTVGGTAYTSGTESSGTAISFNSDSSSGNNNNSNNTPPTKPGN